MVRYNSDVKLGANSLKNAKTAGSVTKVYDKALKGYTFDLEVNSKSKLQLPKDDKASLSLTQPYLVLQVLTMSGKQFSFEVVITDNSKVIAVINNSDLGT